MISFWCFNVLDLFLGTSIAGFAPLPGQGCWKTSGGIWSIRFTTRRETQPGKVESEVNRKGRSVISAYGHLATSMVRRPSVSSVFVNQKIISNCLQFLSLPPSCHLLIGSKKAISPSPCARAKCWFQLLGPEALHSELTGESKLNRLYPGWFPLKCNQKMAVINAQGELARDLRLGISWMQPGCCTKNVLKCGNLSSL